MNSIHIIANIRESAAKLKEIFSEKGSIRIITHLDTDGLSSAAILVRALTKNDQRFTLSIVKQLEQEIIDEIREEFSKPKWKALIFLDLGAGKLHEIREITDLPIFVIDHHEIELPTGNFEDRGKLYLIHSTSEKISAAGLTYMFAKELDGDKRSAQFAVLGMIGDILDKSISKLNNSILADAQESGMKLHRGPTVFSAMRPLHKALEFSSSIFIPGVTGNSSGALEMLREIGIEVKTSNGWRTLMDLNQEEVSRLITAILIRRVNDGRNQDVLDNIYLIKIAGQFWDAREVSTMVNACGRLGQGDIALAFLLDSREAREEVEHIYSEYKHQLIRALNWVETARKVQGAAYVIINAKNFIKDTLIGTVMSILSSSFVYPKGTVIVGMAYRNDNKIKISARVVRDKEDYGREVDLSRLLSSVIKSIGGEVGGHMNAAGGLISMEKEEEFIEILTKELANQEMSIKI
ncbi:MAG: DHH family phosphoesterase [Candidatus Pacearchaeota archaeon]|nr:DHH family phosphoesterase [Candidatus Pacearchaeota archaeon]